MTDAQLDNSVVAGESSTDPSNKSNGIDLLNVSPQPLKRSSSLLQHCMLSNNPLAEDATFLEKARWYFLCPPHGEVGWFLTRLMGLLAGWAALYGVTGVKEAGPGGNLFSIFILYVVSRVFGFIINKIFLPPLLGMLLAGILLNNLHLVYPYQSSLSVASSISPHYKVLLRDVAFITILIRAGLSLNPKGLIQLKNVVIRLAFFPGAIIEAPTIAVVAHFVIGMPWAFSFVLGFILAAVSPAVVVPSLLGLQSKGYGVEQGVPTLIIAAASIDDIIAISAFSVALAIAFAQGGVLWTITKAPLEVAGGIVSSAVIGMLLWYIPPQKKNELDKHGEFIRNPENHTTARFLLLFGFGICFMFGCHRLGYEGAGALGCLSVSFVAGLGWDMDTKKPVGIAFGHAWNSLMPLLFGLIGTEIDFEVLKGETIGSGIFIISVGLVFRLIATFLSVMGIGLNLKEKLFIAIAWMPKATVQAAMGSMPLDAARKAESQEKQDLGLSILTIAVIAILVSAPLGAVGISLSGSKLLQQPKSKGRNLRRGSSITKSDGLPRPLLPPQILKGVTEEDDERSSREPV